MVFRKHDPKILPAPPATVPQIRPAQRVLPLLASGKPAKTEVPKCDVR